LEGLRLFDEPSSMDDGEFNGHDDYSIRGKGVEHILRGELMLRGHQILVPDVDNGIDMVVNWRHRTQVKSSSFLPVRQGGRRSYVRFGLHSHSCRGAWRGRTAKCPDVDIYALYWIPDRTWWFVPHHEMPDKSNVIYITPKMEPWRDFWAIFD
jgi:hypothetical protein